MLRFVCVFGRAESKHISTLFRRSGVPFLASEVPPTLVLFSGRQPLVGGHHFPNMFFLLCYSRLYVDLKKQTLTIIAIALKRYDNLLLQNYFHVQFQCNLNSQFSLYF